MYQRLARTNCKRAPELCHFAEILVILSWILEIHRYLLQGAKQENKSRVLPRLLFYRNICLSLIVHMCILVIHSRFIGCLPFEKCIID
jgi:putative copper export protein